MQSAQVVDGPDGRRWVLLPLCAIVLAPWWYGGAPDSERYALAALLLLTVAAWLWRCPALESRIAIPAMALGAWAFVQAAIGTSPVSTLESALVLVANLTVIVFWSTEARDDRAARWLVYTTLAVCLAQAVFGIVQSTASPSHVYGVTSEVVTTPFGSYVDHNHFAGLMEMAALLAAGLAAGAAIRARGADPRTVVLAGISLALAAALAASRSRGGLVALAVGAAALGPLWYLARSRSRRAVWKSAALAGGIAVVLLGFGWAAVPGSTRSHLATVLRGPSDPSGHYRIAIFGASLRLFASHPLTGAGLGTFIDALPPFKTSEGAVATQHAESDALEFAAEGGIVGLMLLGWLALGIGRNFHQRVTEGHDPLRKGLAIGALAAVVALLVHSFLDFNLRLPANALVFCSLAGLAGAPRTSGPLLSRHWHRPLAAILALLALAAAWRAMGAVELARADEVLEPNARLVRLNDVVRRHPYLTEARLRRGLTWWTLAKGAPGLARLRFEHAAADLETCVRVRPEWSDAWADLGWARFLIGDKAAARAAFDRAAALDPSRMSIGMARAEFLARSGDPDAALRQLLQTRRYNLSWPVEGVVSMAQRIGLDQARIDTIGTDAAQLK